MVEKVEEIGLPREDPDTPSLTDAARSWRVPPRKSRL
jgi:hypothetical protein